MFNITNPTFADIKSNLLIPGIVKKKLSNSVPLSKSRINKKELFFTCDGRNPKFLTQTYHCKISSQISSRNNWSTELLKAAEFLQKDAERVHKKQDNK